MDEVGLDSAGAGRRRTRGVWRVALWIGVVALIGLGVAGVVAWRLVNRAEPLLRGALIDTLQKRFHGRVELDNLHFAAVNGFQAEATGLRIWLPQEAVSQLPGQAAPAIDPEWRSKPWIVVGKVHFSVASRIRPGEPIVVSVIYAQGVRVMLPPKADRPHLSLSGGGAGSGNAEPAPQTPREEANATTGKMHALAGWLKIPDVQIQRIECDDALLVIERTQQPGKPEKMPLNFTFRKVVGIPDGHGGPIAFDVDMVNAMPVGDIHSTGHAGPWVPREPGALPVEGDYSFDRADLSTIKGIAGMLSSTGHYAGTLRKIEADGTTETPDFRLERVSRTAGEMLRTRFHATVDGTNGDTWLEPVDATLGHTHILAKGKVVRAEGTNGEKIGHDIALDVTVDRGRIEDILAISEDKQFLQGNLKLHTSFHLPPGERSVLEKLELKGQFHLDQVRFESEKIQGRIEELSLRGQGKPQEMKTTDPTSVLSEMGGHFKLGEGKLELPDLLYHVPGAEIGVHGAYGMREGTLDFDGDARLEAPISKVVGGWKGILLTPVDPILRKNGAGTDVPIYVKGTRKEPKFGVDFGRLGKTEKQRPDEATEQ